MKVAVTGASGFVGKHVLRALALREVDIVALSRTPPQWQLPARARHVSIDICAKPERAFEDLGKPNVVIHLAWGGLPNYLSLHHFESELPAQYRFLKALVEGGLRSLLVTGTCYEYGMLSGELSEEMAAAPANPYAYAKVALHRQLQFLQTQTPFALTWARLFYMWGEGQARGSLYPLLKAAVERGDATFPMSKGEQLRDYLPIDEVAQTIVELALRPQGCGVTNICSGQPVSIRSLVEGWIARNKWAIAPELGRYPYPTYEPLAFWGSRKKLAVLLGTAGAADRL